jgi:hypothetical protein
MEKCWKDLWMVHIQACMERFSYALWIVHMKETSAQCMGRPMEGVYLGHI